MQLNDACRNTRFPQLVPVRESKLSGTDHARRQSPLLFTANAKRHFLDIESTACARLHRVPRVSTEGNALDRGRISLSG